MQLLDDDFVICITCSLVVIVDLIDVFILLFVFQPKFLDLAFGAALGVFMALEIVRVS